MYNSTLLNTTSYALCTFDWEAVEARWFAAGLVTSLASFVGNIVLIVVVCRTRTMRTCTDYLVVSMAVSDIFIPSLSFSFHMAFLSDKFAGNLSQTTGTVLCKLISFFYEVSYEVSMLSLTVFTVYRFYAVVFPMRARVQNRRTCIILLLFTWVLAIALSSITLFFYKFSLKYQFCFMDLSRHHLRILDTIHISFFFFVPLLVMLVMYPVIIVKLRRQQIPGNANRSKTVIRRRNQNFRLTTMFITITVAFILCWGMIRVMYQTYLVSLVTDWCTFLKVYSVVVIFPTVFHAVNPVIYFSFCPSYRRGIKQLLSCCCRCTHVYHAAGGDQIVLGNIPQA